ncbi:MAG TPA: type II secretion system secretin GspD [Burkholderiaceae bacterium]|nr:type II secretion system secretin GspD [Burkholderiaceae bacterium]
MQARLQACVLNPTLIAALVLGGLPPRFAQAQDAAPAAKPRAAAKSASAAKSREPITLNFVNAEIDAVSRAMAVILDRQIIVDPRVKGTITLYSEVPLAPSEAYLNYLSALRGLGFAMVEVNGLLKVVPEADAKLQTGTVSVGGVGRKGDQILTQIFRLQHENANNMVTVLRPLITPNNTINANPTNNTLVITDYADNLQRIAKMIAAMDIPAATDVEVIPVQYASAADLLPMVQKLVDTSANTPGAVPGGGGMSLMADARTNSILVRAPNSSRLAMVRSMVAKLDRPLQGTGVGGGNIYVIYLKNADAVKLAQVLRAAYGGSGGGGGGSSASGPSSAGLAPQQQQLATSSGGASPQATAPVQASAGPSTGGFVQADPSTNSLIITAPEPLYRQMRTVIDQLDSRRAQVYIESMIVEVNADNNADFGFQWQGIHESKAAIGGTNLPIQSRIPGILDLAVAGKAALAGVGGLNIGILKDLGGGISLAVLAHALQTQSKTNVMATPNLVTLDNEEAKIVVGDNVPFITGQSLGTGANASPFQTIERKDVGLTLRIKPQIGEGGTVRMTIFQESSDVKDQAKGTANAGPTTSKRSIESTVVVDDGQIIVLGGLIQDKYTDSVSKVPLLGDIPVVGHLFRSESRSKARTNLMVFIRPTVMRDADSSGKLSQDRYDAIRAQQQGTQPSKHLLIPVDEIPVLDTASTRLIPPRIAPAASGSAP